MTAKRALGAFFAAASVLTLSACTPGVAQHWRVTESGDVSFADCYSFSIDSLIVSTRVTAGGGAQEFELNGPKIFFGKGESFSLSAIADGWNDAEKLDMEADWHSLSLVGFSGDTETLRASVERRELAVGEWVQVPHPGIGVVGCERV